MDTYVRHHFFLAFFWCCVLAVVGFTVYWWSGNWRFFGYDFGYGCYDAAPLVRQGGAPSGDDAYAALLRANPIVALNYAEVSGLGYLFLCVVPNVAHAAPASGSSLVPAPVPSAAVAPASVRVPIMVYHLTRPCRKTDSSQVREFDTSPALMDEEFKYLSDNGYTSITPDDLANVLTKGAPLPPKPVMLTFDDGWEVQYLDALPLLKKYHFVGTFYIYTNAIGHKHYLTWNEVKAMDKAGMEIAGHTKSHPYLVSITDEKVLQDEIAGGKRIIEAQLGHPITAFAVPFGHYDEQIIQTAKDAGYTTLRTTYPGVIHTTSDLFSLTAQLAPEHFAEFKTLI